MQSLLDVERRLVAQLIESEVVSFLSVHKEVLCSSALERLEVIREGGHCREGSLLMIH